MPATPEQLHRPLDAEELQLEPLSDAHRAALAAACAADADIWHIYAANFGPPDFDRNFSALLANPGRLAFAIMHRGALAGMSAYLRLDPTAQTLEIGNSYLAPAFRGTGLNGAVKRLMIDRAFACGFRRIEFRVDARNARSRAAVLKLGAKQEGLLRAERITWTGHVRDTILFALLRDEWTGARTA